MDDVRTAQKQRLYGPRLRRLFLAQPLLPTALREELLRQERTQEEDGSRDVENNCYAVCADGKEA